MAPSPTCPGERRERRSRRTGPLAEQHALERVELGLTAIGRPVFAQRPEHAVDHGQRPAPLVEDFRRLRIGRFNQIAVFGDYRRPRTTARRPRRVYRGMAPGLVVGEKVLERGQQEGPKAAVVLADMLEVTPLQQRREKALREIARIIRRAAAAPALWSRIASMTRTSTLLLAVAIGTLGGCRADSGPGTTKPAATANATTSAPHDIDRASMDTSVSPGDDFYHYANGAWLKNTEIPADRASYGVFDILVEESQQRTKGLLEEAASGKAAAGSDERKIGDYYASYLDEATIEKRGVTPLEPVLNAIAAIADRRALSRWIGQSLRADVDPLNATNFYTDHVFGVWFAQDLNDPSRQAPYLLQGGLGLPDRDYYIEGGKEMDRVRAAYRTHLVNVLTLAKHRRPCGDRDTDLRFRAQDCRGALDAHPVGRCRQGQQSLDACRVRQESARHRLACVLRRRRSERCPTFIVWQPDAIAGIARLVAVEPMPVWREYLSFHAVDRNARRCCRRHSPTKASRSTARP